MPVEQLDNPNVKALHMAITSHKRWLSPAYITRLSLMLQ